MADQFAVFVDGVDVDLLAGVSNEARRRAAVMAINTMARNARAKAARMIRDQINVPASFVGEANKRLYIAKKAQGKDLEAIIRARGRATSLARFVTGPARVGGQQKGVTVEVQPGKARFMKRAFLIRLPQGNNAVTDTQFNLGLAVRLKPGESLNKKVFARRVESGLYVLYGPSVAQIFEANDNTGVKEDLAPEVAEKLEAEFRRLIALNDRAR